MLDVATSVEGGLTQRTWGLTPKHGGMLPMLDARRVAPIARIRHGLNGRG